MQLLELGLESCDINIIIEITCYLDPLSVVNFVSTCKFLYGIKTRTGPYELIKCFENPPNYFPLDQDEIKLLGIEEKDTKNDCYHNEWRFILASKFGYTKLCKKFLDGIIINTKSFLVIGIGCAKEFGRDETLSYLLDISKKMHTDHHYASPALRRSIIGSVFKVIENTIVSNEQSLCFTAQQERMCIDVACEAKMFSYVEWMADNSCSLDYGRVLGICLEVIRNIDTLKFVLEKSKPDVSVLLRACLYAHINISDEHELDKVVELMEDKCGKCLCKRIIPYMQTKFKDEERSDKMRSRIAKHEERQAQRRTDTLVELTQSLDE